MGDTSEISSVVEGPQQKIETYISKDSYQKQWSGSSDPYSWLYAQIEQQLPSGEIKDAIHASLEEKRARMKTGQNYAGPILTEGAKKYAFRGIKRRSDKGPMWEHPESTLDSVDQNLFLNGIDTSDTRNAKNISSGVILDDYPFPKPEEIARDGLDVGIIMVYHNEPFVVPLEQDRQKMALIQPYSLDVSHNRKIVESAEAKSKGYPTLRDIYVGQVVVNFR
jgi:hypothetical protein